MCLPRDLNTNLLFKRNFVQPEKRENRKKLNFLFLFIFQKMILPRNFLQILNDNNYQKKSQLFFQRILLFRTPGPRQRPEDRMRVLDQLKGTVLSSKREKAKKWKKKKGEKIEVWMRHKSLFGLSVVARCLWRAVQERKKNSRFVPFVIPISIMPPVFHHPCCTFTQSRRCTRTVREREKKRKKRLPKGLFLLSQCAPRPILTWRTFFQPFSNIRGINRQGKNTHVCRCPRVYGLFGVIDTWRRGASFVMHQANPKMHFEKFGQKILQKNPKFSRLFCDSSVVEISVLKRGGIFRKFLLFSSGKTFLKFFLLWFSFFWSLNCLLNSLVIRNNCWRISSKKSFVFATFGSSTNNCGGL